jgi:hypothetical protein
MIQKISDKPFLMNPKLPKPIKPGWRFLRKNEIVKRGDRYQFGKGFILFSNEEADKFSSIPVSDPDIGVHGGAATINDGICGYIRKIRPKH